LRRDTQQEVVAATKIAGSPESAAFKDEPSPGA
jgi:hypothetical protein